MSRILRAPRYAEGASPSLVQFITDRLPYLSFREAMGFYTEATPKLKPTEVALLGCNDRFWLLTGLMNRVDMIHPWQYERAREVEADPDGYLDLWARGHGKSSWISCGGVIQELLIDPEITVGIFSCTKDIARPFLSQIKQELESNDALKLTYCDVLWANPRTEAPSWSLDGGLVVKRKGNPKEASIEAHGLIDAMPTGRHFALLVFDDIVTERNVTNPEQVAKATERVELADNLGIGDGTRKWMIGTRYSYSDSYGVLLDHKIVKERIYPATDDGTLDGKPVFLSQEAWDEKKKAQRSTISAQMLQDPVAGNEQAFRIGWLKSYWVRPVMMNVYIMGDPSKGRSKTSDRTAIVVIGIDSNANFYLLDGYCHRMPLSERWKRLQELHKKWSNTPGVQSISVGWEVYGLTADNEYFEEQMRVHGYRFDVKELAWTGQVGRQSKAARVERLEPAFRSGSFFFPARIWNPHVIDPETGKQSKSAVWFVEDGGDEFKHRHFGGHNRDERRVIQNGERWRLVDPLLRRDEDGNLYDVTRFAMEEIKLFPFAPHDDFVDAMSRVYDLEPRPAVVFESLQVPDYQDA